MASRNDRARDRARRNEEQGADLNIEGRQYTLAEIRQIIDARVEAQVQAQNAAVRPVEDEQNVQFALTPALVNPNRPINYATTSGAKLFKSSVAALPVTLDLDPRSINTFNEALKDRCANAAWDNPGSDIVTIAIGNENKHLIDQYGELTVEQVRAHCEGYINEQTRQSQHSYQMYECLMNSLTEAARMKISADSAEFTIGNTKCGPLLYRHLIGKIAIDTRATLSHIRENLSNLDTYITTVSSNISLFNDYVKEQRLNLAARGGVTHDLMTNLWKAYLNASDHEFVGYIRQKKDRYEEGGEMDPDVLMREAENKYKTLLQEERWNALSPEQTQLVTLTAQLKKLNDSRVSIGKGGKSRKNKNKDKDEKDDESNKEKSSKKRKSGKKNNRKDKLGEKWAWKKVPPKDGEPHEKSFEGKKYYWCHFHAFWTLTKHTAENCTKWNNAAGKETISNAAKHSKSEDKSSSQKVSFATQLQDIILE